MDSFAVLVVSAENPKSFKWALLPIATAAYLNFSVIYLFEGLIHSV